MMLLETKNSLQNLSHLTSETGLSNMANVDSDGANEGVCLLWMDDVDLDIRLVSIFFIEFQVNNPVTSSS